VHRDRTQRQYIFELEIHRCEQQQRHEQQYEQHMVWGNGDRWHSQRHCD
jgi:hypothetical protein